MNTRREDSRSRATQSGPHQSPRQHAHNGQQRSSAVLRVSDVLKTVQREPLGTRPADIPLALALRLLLELVHVLHSNGAPQRSGLQTCSSTLGGGPLRERELDDLVALGLIKRRDRCEFEPDAAIPNPYSLTGPGAVVINRLSVTLGSFLNRPIPRPHWDASRRELRLGVTILKRFRRPAPNQELILTAFEEQDWPERIDDPLPHSRQVDPRHRLHETIKSLNQGLKSGVIHFGGDGTGKGVLWIVTGR